MIKDNNCFINASDTIVDWLNSETIIIDNKNINELQTIINNINHQLIVQFLPIEYLIDRTIFVSSNVWLKGSNEGETCLKLKSQSNCHILTNNNYKEGNKNIKVSNIKFDGNSLNQQRVPGDKRLLTCNAMYFKQLNLGEFNDLQANNILHAGLHLNECRNIKITNFSSSHIGWSGISSSQADNLIILNAYIYDSGLDKMHSGIHLDGGNGVYINAHVKKSTGNGVMLDSNYAPFHNGVVECIVSDCKRGLGVCGSKHNLLNNVNITGDFSQNREVGVLISNATNVSVLNASIKENNQYGVLLQGSVGAKSCTISKCNIEKNEVSVAEIHNSSDNFFLLNNFKDNKKPQSIKSQMSLINITEKEINKFNEINNGDRKNSKISKDHSYEDICHVCGLKQVFYKQHQYLREGYRCTHCKASLRHRGQAYAITSTFTKKESVYIKDLIKEEQFRNLSIYEPGIIGPFREYFNDFSSYTNSYYWDDISIGEYKSAVQCQNLEDLTYKTSSFDLIITSDIMEHVRHPWKAFEEILRVLKPGGYHIFTIPVQKPICSKSTYRVDTSEAQDIHLLEPRYHIAGDGSKSLVYTEFGKDIVDNLQKIGFEIEIQNPSVKDPEIQKLMTFISKKSIKKE